MLTPSPSPPPTDLEQPDIIQQLRIKNIGRIIIGNLNVNSLISKFEELKIKIKGKVDILVLTETKLDSSFPINQFYIDGYKSPYRQDRNRNGGGVMIYVREDIPSKELNSHNFPNVIFNMGDSVGPIEGIFLEINFRKCKWLLFGTYHRPSQNKTYYLDKITHALDIYIKKYDRFLLAGDCNMVEHDTIMSVFLNQYDCKNLVRDPTCYKNVANPSCIDLLITNSPRSFQTTKVINIGCSDFHKMSITVLKIKFDKSKPKEINYRNYSKFDQKSFRNDLSNAMGKQKQTYEEFEKLYLEVLEKHAPFKQKIIRGNHAPYMNKALRKAIMKRTQLQNKYYRSGNDVDAKLYKKQRHFVTRFYKKQKKKYFNSMDVSNFTDNKKFLEKCKSTFL